MKKSTDFEKIAHLIPLRVTGDVSADEAQQVDEAARYDETSRQELQSYQQLMAVLQEASTGPLPKESSVIRGEKSLWDRIEPRLGPVSRPRPNIFHRVPTGYLAIACGLMLCVTAVSEFGSISGIPVALAPGWNAGGVQTVNNGPSATPVDPRKIVRLNVSVPISESVAMRDLGFSVARVERVMQRAIGLPDLNAVLVTEVVPSSIADRMGLRPGDSLLKIGDQRVYAPLHAVEVFEKEMNDGEAPVEVFRNGQKHLLQFNRAKPDGHSFRMPIPSEPVMNWGLST